MLEYTLTVDDLAAFAAWRASRSDEEEARRRRLRLVGAWIAGGLAYLVAFAVLPLPLLLTGQLPLAGISEVLAVLVGGAAGLWEWRRGRLGHLLLVRRYRAKARAALTRTGAARRIGLGDGGLAVAAGDRSTTVPWADITGVVETDEHVFVLTGGNAAHVLPRRVDPRAVAAIASAVRTPQAGQG